MSFRSTTAAVYMYKRSRAKNNYHAVVSGTRLPRIVVVVVVPPPCSRFCDDGVMIDINQDAPF